MWNTRYNIFFISTKRTTQRSHGGWKLGSPGFMVIKNGVKILTSIRVGTYLGWRDFEEEDGTAKRDGALKEILERPCKKETKFVCSMEYFSFDFELFEGWRRWGIYRSFGGWKWGKNKSRINGDWYEIFMESCTWSCF